MTLLACINVLLCLALYDLGETFETSIVTARDYDTGIYDGIITNRTLRSVSMQHLEAIIYRITHFKISVRSFESRNNLWS
jgi:hypothetical protein